MRRDNVKTFLAVIFFAVCLISCGSGGGGSDGKDPPVENPILNNPPEANNDVISMFAGESATFNPLANDSDVDGNIDLTSFIPLNFPVGHTLEIGMDGRITYWPPEKFNGVVQFDYSVSDDDGAVSVANIEITVKLKSMSLIAESGVGAAFYKDGIKFYSRGGGAGGGRGFNIAIFDIITGELIEEPRNYDTWGGGSVKGSALADYIDHEIPVGAIVMLAVGDSAGNYGTELANTLEELGATQAGDIGWRHTWAMIAIKGEGPLDEVRETGHWEKISAIADITLELEDPHGDTIDTATQLGLNNAVLGHLYEGETDMFWLDLQHDGVLVLSVSNPDETLTIVKNSQGEVLASSVDYHQFTDKSIKCYLGSGIHYVEVRSLDDLAVGSFVLKSQYIVDPPLPEDLTLTARSSSGVQFAVNGEIFFARSGGAGGGRGFNIAVVDSLTGIILEPGINFDTYGGGELKGNELSAYIDGTDDGLMLLLAVGDSAGNYGTELANTLEELGATQAGDIGWRHTWAMIAIKGEGPLDEVRETGHWDTVIAESTITVPGHEIAGDTIDEAITLDVNSKAPGFVHEDDVDYYHFTLTDDGNVSLESRGDVDTLLHLYKLDAQDNIIEIFAADDGGSGYNFLLQEDLLAGTYYIEIEGHGTVPVGQYDLLVMTH